MTREIEDDMGFAGLAPTRAERDAERRHDQEVKRLREAVTASQRYREALVHAVSVIQTWHNMGMKPKEASDMWDIYWRNAPEMKPIREALAT